MTGTGTGTQTWTTGVTTIALLVLRTGELKRDRYLVKLRRGISQNFAEILSPGTILRFRVSSHNFAQTCECCPLNITFTRFDSQCFRKSAKRRYSGYRVCFFLFFYLSCTVCTFRLKCSKFTFFTGIPVEFRL